MEAPVNMAAPELSKLVSSAAEAARGAEAGDAAARDRALDSLRLLSRAAVTATLLKETDAGKRVNRLSKSTDEEVAAAASKVVLAWKDCVKRGVAAADGVTAAAGALSRRGSEAALASQRSTGGAASSSSGLPGDDAAVGDSADASRPTVNAGDAQQQQAPSGSRPSLPPVPTQAAAAAAAAAVPSKTGDARRDRIRQLLSDALALVPLDERGGADPGAVGAAVEDAVHAKYGGSGPDYSAKVRSLSFNLKDPANPDLRTRVLRGNVTPQVLVDLSAEELASDSKRQENERIRKEAAAEAVRGQTQQASTDMFKCSRCKQKKCTYYQMQTRSADEPMTTFVTCVACGNKWKFC